MQNKNYAFTLAMFALSFTLVFTSCSKDDDPNPITKEQVSGLWELDSYSVALASSGASTPLTAGTGSGETIEFRMDDTAVATNGTSSKTGTWLLNGNNIEVTFPNDGSTTLDLDNVNLTSGSYEIKEIAAAKLVLFRKTPYSSTGITVNVDVIINLKK